jgi:iron complex outermembrane receptor protein
MTPCCFVLGLLLLQSDPGASGGQTQVTDIDLEDLLKVHVSGAMRKEQPVADVPAAVYVLREDDLRRSGATTLGDALRAVPGLQVARTRSGAWAITSRGFSDTLANKMLVLIDGRSVYSPIHSGVFWDVQDPLLEDVERIEVIRGPGGSLWGANAINGIINIVTKNAGDTQQGMVSGGVGTEERSFVSARYGFSAGEALKLRVYAKYFDRDDLANGLDRDAEAHDDWFLAHAGFRSDWQARGGDRVTFQGDYYDGDLEEVVTRPLIPLAPGAPTSETFEGRNDLRGGNLLARWDRVFDPSSSLSLQVYYDYTYRRHPLFEDVIHTGDLDFQHRFSPFEGHDLIWGLGYRAYRSRFDGSFLFGVEPNERTDDVMSAFVQDEISFVNDELRLTLGTKVENNDYSGFEVQPSVRLAWIPQERHTLWGSVSRAVRTPSIIDVDGRLTPLVLPGTPPIAVSIFGNDAFRSEALISYEGGYRVRPASRLHFDFAFFFNDYDHLRSGSLGTPFLEESPSPVHTVVPVNLGNDLTVETRGAEVAANFQATPRWLLQANYAYLHLEASEETPEGRDPNHQLWLRSALDLSSAFSLDVMARYVGRLPAFELDAYWEADVRFAWRDPSGRVETALVGQNLLHPSHPEYQVASQRNEVQRGVYASVRWRF